MVYSISRSKKIQLFSVRELVVLKLKWGVQRGFTCSQTFHEPAVAHPAQSLWPTLPLTLSLLLPFTLLLHAWILWSVKAEQRNMGSEQKRYHIQPSNMCGGWICIHKSSFPWILLNLMEVVELGKWGLGFFFAIGKLWCVHFTSLHVTSFLYSSAPGWP